MDRREKHTHDMSGSSGTVVVVVVYIAVWEILRFVSSSSPLYSLLSTVLTLGVFDLSPLLFFTPSRRREQKSRPEKTREKEKQEHGYRNIQHESWKKETESGGCWLAGWLVRYRSSSRIGWWDPIVRLAPFFFPSFLYLYTRCNTRPSRQARTRGQRLHDKRSSYREDSSHLFPSAFLLLFFLFYSANFLVFLSGLVWIFNITSHHRPSFPFLLYGR